MNASLAQEDESR